MSDATILALVQAAPDISTSDGDYVSSLIDKAKERIKLFCALSEFPALTQATVIGATGATEDISGLATNTIYVFVDQYTSWQEVALTLANCTGGNATAAELQAQIRATDVGDAVAYLWSGITVAWDSTNTRYTVTHSVYGRDHSIGISFAGDEYHVAQAMRLAPQYGAQEHRGTDRDETLEAIAAQMVIDAYRRIKLEPEGYDDLQHKSALMDTAFNAAMTDNKQHLLGRRQLRTG